MNKWLFIQALRGVAVLGVVAFHLMSIEIKYSGGDLFLPDFLLLGQSGVDLFFVISGFVMVSVTKGRFESNREIARFLWGRLTRIYPTYWFYFFLTGIIFVIRPNWVNSSQDHQADLFSSFLLLPGQYLPLVMVAWSLIHELWFYTVFALLLKFNEKRLIPFLFAWGMIVVMANAFATPADQSAGVRIILHPYTLEFIIGAFVAIFVSGNLSQKFISRVSIKGFMALLVIALPCVYAFNVLKDASIMRVTVMGTLYGLVVFFLAILEREKKIFVPRFLQFIGDISYTVYLSHILILSAIGRVWMMVNPAQNSLVDNMIVCLIMLASVVSYGCIGYRLVEQPILRISHRLRIRWFENRLAEFV